MTLDIMALRMILHIMTLSITTTITMEQCIFVQYLGKHIGGSSKKVNRYIFLWEKVMSINSFSCLKLSVVFKNTFFVQ